MKKYLITTLIIFILFCSEVLASSGSMIGRWQGQIQIGQQTVPIIFNVKDSKTGLLATMDSPLQGAKDIPIKSLTIKDNEVIFDIAVAGALYQSTRIGDTLDGTWNQSGQSFPLKMVKGLQQLKTVKKKTE